MVLLQPTDTPSRTGINNAITTEIADHASTSDPTSQHYDSGWVPVPFASGWKNYQNTWVVRRVGQVVYMRGYVTESDDAINPTGSSGSQIGTLPAGFTPNGSSHVAAVPTQNPGTQPARLFINPSGTVVLFVYGTGTTSYANVMTSYLI